MKEYSVKEIAALLGTNQETVRRWIRTGKLKAVDNSSKKGESKVILESALNSFLKASPKYAAVASTLTSNFSLKWGVAALGIGILNAAFAATSEARKIENNRTKKAKVTEDETIIFLAKSIEENRTELEKLMIYREDLDKKIQAQTEILNTHLQQLKLLVANQESAVDEEKEDDL